MVNPDLKEDLIAYLAQYVTPERWQRMEEVLAWRTRYVVMVLEDVYQPHNASAVLRSCEIFGVQDVHVIEKENVFRPNRDIALGAAQWLTLHRHRRTRQCLEALKEQGYQVAALTLRDDSVGINELSLERPVALCLGTEEEGLSREAHDLADTFVQLPMYGFTQSFNVSVTAALSLYTVARRLHKANVAWRLPDEEKRDLLLQWLQQSIPRGETVARHFLQRGE